MTIKVMSIFGTRPEAIKMAPVVFELQNDPMFESVVCVTAQHREMLDQVLDVFEITPDYDLDLMKSGQDLASLTSSVLSAVTKVLRENRPDLVLVHGDTTTCLASGLAAFYEKIPFGHVEAGLRTGDLYAPFPEEANRSLIGNLAHFHFSPTEIAKKNLLNENIANEKIIITGNTVIDALLIAKDKISLFPKEYWEDIFGESLIQKVTDASRKTILITGHRRENFGQGFIDLCNTIKKLAVKHPDWNFIYPVHLNPNVQAPVNNILGNCENIDLIDPVSYLPFVWLMNESDIILTDSGGIQEEGPSLGKPVFVTREVTERPEALDAGTVKLVGTNPDKIFNNIESILLDEKLYNNMAHSINPYGDGQASSRIIEFIKKNI